MRLVTNLYSTRWLGASAPTLLISAWNASLPIQAETFAGPITDNCDSIASHLPTCRY